MNLRIHTAMEKLAREAAQVIFRGQSLSRQQIQAIPEEDIEKDMEPFFAGAAVRLRLKPAAAATYRTMFAAVVRDEAYAMQPWSPAFKLRERQRT